MLNYIIWNVNPAIIEGFGVRWYGLFFALGFFVSYTMLNKILVRDGLKQKEVDNFTFLVFVFLIIGLRLGHCLFYEPAEYLANPIRILYIWEGGLASHGGAVGLLLAFYVFAHRTKRSFLWIASRAAIVIPFTAGMVRLGNLMNSEIYGITSSLPWSFVFVRDAIITATPEVLTNAVINSGAVVSGMQTHIAEFFEMYTHNFQRGVPFAEISEVLIQQKYIIPDSLPKLVDSFMSARLLSAHHPTQIYEAAMYFFTLACLMYYYKSRISKDLPLSDNFLLGITLTMIFVFRFFIEFIKNDQVAFEQTMHLNMGQWLSIPFILFGLFLLYRHFVHFKPTQK